jgi:hypothetical protein
VQYEFFGGAAQQGGGGRDVVFVEGTDVHGSGSIA